MLRTEHALHEALLGLVREKEYDAIAVREILDRANVGRSTFYSHFDNKDELLGSGVEHVIAGLARDNALTSFGLAVFEHHDEHRRTGWMSPKARMLLHQRLRTTIAARVRNELPHAPSRHDVNASVPPDLRAQFVASTFVLVLDWWLDSRSPLTPAEVNKLFISLVASALT